MNRQSDNKTIVFFVMALSQPRCIKRVTSLNEYGFNCIVYGYDRGKYDVNSYNNNVAVNNLGQLKDNEYIAKGIKIFKDLLRVRREHRSSKTVFYAFGLFFALYLRLLGERYIYEISDILYAYPRFRRFLKFLKAVDKNVIKKSVATVMTSGGFYSFFNINSPKVFVIPNKVSPTLSRPAVNLRYMETGKLSFGFVGSLRYQTILSFAEVIGKHFPEYEFHFWGGLMEGQMKSVVDRMTRSYSNVFYHGAFRNPSDLPAVYDSFDITVSCYQVTSLNERIAEPNKLYESLFFCKPIVVSDNIYLAARVKELGCGYCIQAETEESIMGFVSSLDVSHVKDVAVRTSQIDLKEIVNDQSALNRYIEEKAFKL